MKFKEFRDLIFSPCYVIVDNFRVFVETHYDSEFDNYEVVGVRAQPYDEFDDCVVVELAKSDFNIDLYGGKYISQDLDIKEFKA